MASESLANGLVVEFPDGLQLREIGDGNAGETRGGLGARRDDAISQDTLDLVEDFGGALQRLAAESQEFDQIARFELVGSPNQSGLGLGARRDSTSEGEIALRLPLEEGEAAVLLSEEGGVLRWEYPEIVEVEPRPHALGAERIEGGRVALWRSPYRPEPETGAQGGLGFDVGTLLKPIKKLVLRFAARKAAESLTTYLERNLVEGPILFRKDVDGKIHWQGESLSHAFKSEGPHRLLLFVHGTFSSVDGSFGGLLATQEGTDFLSRALEDYEAVVGFDHKTLTKGVKQNAEELFAALQELPEGEVHFDAIAFSRGGLVLRQLTELLLPAIKPKSRFHLGKAVFVGCTNGGTLLADPNHWKELLDLYTNLVYGAGKLVALVGGPSSQVATRMVSGAMRGTFSFVRYLAEAATGDDVPGLASMNPLGNDVKLLNERQEGQPLPANVAYYVIDADFDHKLFGEDALTNLGLSKRLFLEFADHFIDRLFQQAPNDLVVDKASMSSIDPWETGWIQGSDGFAKNEGIYHTVYFSSKKVAEKLSAWLLDR